ncbi:phytoene desaturase family protein [Exiguobacterium oxidotolerans]|uniref:4,4'-diapolycopen-4-al dehydrogenase n=1 Tax=Exiguobacterium oxidotolerans TaxID=223958 RepID=A0A653I300_9BACL|nr:phytoene desaturase family protein [Exiguobacterium oxidotolerans]VWX33203.1 4,4'-diapolycopen-4-al dehydrogenase [Exiguobacterium oxidotolerans]
MKIGFVGAGVGTLHAALLLTKRYPEIDITIYEKEGRVGGRLASVDFKSGGRIDQGPTIVLMPGKLQEQLAEAGLDGVELLRIDPLYDLHFDDGTVVTKLGDVVDQAVAIERQFGEGRGFSEFMHQKSKDYDISVSKFLERSYFRKSELLQPGMLKPLVKMHALETAHDHLKRYFKNKYLRMAYSFPTFYIGGNPYTTPSIYGLIPYREQAEGVWYVKGGYFSLAERMYEVLVERGVRFEFNQSVERVTIQDGQATGIVVGDAEYHYDNVVLNGEFPLMEYLVEGKKPKAYTPSGGTLLLYFKMRGKVNLPVHRFLMPNDLEPLMNSIFHQDELPEHPAVYLFNPSKVDDSLTDCEDSVVYALVPSPRNFNREKFEQHGFIETILTKIESHHPGFRDQIEEMQIRTPQDAKEFGLYEGGSFGIAPTIRQSAALKTQARPYPDIERLYAVGASVHPCGGVPIVMMGATLLVNRMEQEMRWKNEYSDAGIRNV